MKQRRLNPFVPPNARFWVWWNDGPVKITLRPGETLTMCHSARTDEGWSAHLEEYWHAGDSIERETISDGTDCDGRLTRTWKESAHLHELNAVPLLRIHAMEFNGEYRDLYPSDLFAAHTHNGRECMRPVWREVNSWQRDYTAEAMGY